tara:strand:+ start:319 stop:939 length:621 start_codon:yes stop_codon:yes gene_type:complete
MTFLSDINVDVLACGLIISYLLGSISFGILFTKIMDLGNLRSLGSGNIGATNVLRTGNKVAAALTLIFDSGKGFVVIHASVIFLEPAYVPFTGIAVFIGHIFPIYHKFKGGKGVATFLGIFLATDFVAGLLICCTWLSLAIFTKKSSIAALGCSLLTPLFLFLNQSDPNLLFPVTLTVLIWWLHKENIKRIILKTEPSINFKKSIK